MEEVQLDLKRKEDLVMRKKLRACSSSPIRQRKSPKFLEPLPFVPFSQRAQSYTSLRKPTGGKLTEPGEDSEQLASKESPTLIECETGGRKHANRNKQIANDPEQRRALAVENCKDMKKDMKSILLWQIKGIQEGSVDSMPEVPIENTTAEGVNYTEERHNSKASSKTKVEMNGHTNISHHVDSTSTYLAAALPPDIEKERKQDLPYSNRVSKIDALDKTVNGMFTCANVLPLSVTLSSDLSEDKKGTFLESKAPYKLEAVKTTTMDNQPMNKSTTLTSNLTERNDNNKRLPLILSCPPDKPNKMKHLKNTKEKHKSVGEDDGDDFPPPPPPEETPAPMEYIPRDIFSPPPPPPPAPVATLSSSINLPSSASCLSLAHKLKTKLRTKSEDRKQELEKRDEQMKFKLEAKDKEVTIMLMQKENEYENKIKDLSSMLENNMNVVLKDLKCKLEKKDNELKDKISAKDEELTKSVNQISTEYKRDIDMLTLKLECIENELMKKNAELKNKETQAVGLSLQVFKCSSVQEKTISELGGKLAEADGKIRSLELKAMLTDKEQSLFLKKIDDLETEVRLKNLKIAALEENAKELRKSVKKIGNSNNINTSLECSESDQADSLLARLKPEAVNPIIVKLFEEVHKKDQSNIVICLVNKLDTEDLLDVLSTLLATEQLGEVILKAMDLKSRRQLILRFMEGDNEFSDFSEFLAFSELDQLKNNKIVSETTKNANSYEFRTPLIVEADSISCNIRDLEAEIAVLSKDRYQNEFSDESDSESESKTSSQNTIIRRSSQDILKWLEGMDSKAIPYGEGEVQKDENNLPTIESRISYHDQSYDFTEVEYSYIFAGCAVNLPDKHLPVYKAQEHLLLEALTTESCTHTLFCEEINNGSLENNKSNNQCNGNENHFCENAQLGDLETQCTEMSFTLEDAEENELEYFEVENRVKQFKGSIGFAVLKPRNYVA